MDIIHVKIQVFFGVNFIVPYRRLIIEKSEFYLRIEVEEALEDAMNRSYPHAASLLQDL